MFWKFEQTREIQLTPLQMLLPIKCVEFSAIYWWTYRMQRPKLHCLPCRLCSSTFRCSCAGILIQRADMVFCIHNKRSFNCHHPNNEQSIIFKNVVHLPSSSSQTVFICIFSLKTKILRKTPQRLVVTLNLFSFSLQCSQIRLIEDLKPNISTCTIHAHTHTSAQTNPCMFACWDERFVYPWKSDIIKTTSGHVGCNPRILFHTI